MAYKAEEILPFNGDEKKSVQVERMFNEIAEDYDPVNRHMSMGIDNRWRRRGITSLKAIKPKAVLDVASGTGDMAVLSAKILKPEKILAIDISEEMMQIGRYKVNKAGLENMISFEKQNIAKLLLPDNSFDCASLAFGIRNFEDIDASLEEILRVLKPSGMLMMLELSEPGNKLFRLGYLIYNKIARFFIRKKISKNIRAYNYLQESIEAFPQGEQMKRILQKNGFLDVTFKRFTFGVCTMYLARKSSNI